MGKAEGTAMDENVVAFVAASCRAGTFSALTREEHADLVRSIILAYEAAKPAPMSTSGEMVERLRIKSSMILMGEKIAAYSECALMDEAASRLESLEALFAEQAGELESAESHAQMLLLAVEAGDPKPELAMRVKDLISFLSDIRKARGKE